MRLLRPGHLLAIAPLLALCAACTFVRVACWNVPTLAAPGMFDERPVTPATAASPLPRRSREENYDALPPGDASPGAFDRMLSASGTAAFVVIRDDAIAYERYFGDFAPDSLLPSFSLCKTIAGMLVGIAHDHGILPSMQSPVTDFVPELADRPRYRDVTLDHLLRMTSGIDFEEESYDAASLYYCTDLRAAACSYPITAPPGDRYRYSSVDVQLLWEALQRRLGNESVARFMQERLWQPLGAEHAATWSLDSRDSGAEKFFGGFNATVRDYARLGLLYLHDGEWNGRRILDRRWVRESLEPDPVAGVQTIADGKVRRGRYQWFLTMDDSAYFAKGYHGQYLFVMPAQRVVIVRFGNGYGDVRWLELFARLAKTSA